MERLQTNDNLFGKYLSGVSAQRLEKTKQATKGKTTTSRAARQAG